MDSIHAQIAKARRRLIAGQFLTILPWCLTATLAIAALALAVPKLWVLEYDAQLWSTAWLSGAVVIGFIAAGVWTYVARRSQLEAAVEIDRRCGLKERVSSLLALDAADLETSAGQALARDAERRIAGVDVPQQFRVSISRRSWFPLVPALAAMVLVLFVSDKLPDPATASASKTSPLEVKRTTEVLKKRLADQRKKAEELGLKDAKGLFEKLEKQTGELEKKDKVDQRDALVKLNDLAKQLEARRKELGRPDKMEEQLDRLKNLPKGPADKMADAVREGDLDKAQKELKNLQQQIADGKLNKEDKDKLAEQLGEMQKKLDEAVQQQKQAKEELKQQLDKAQASGDVEKADKLQQALDKLQQQMPAADALDKLAQQLGAASEQMKSGDAKGAAQQLDKIADQLEQMKEQLEESELLDQALDQIADAKQQMNGQGKNGNQPGQQPGDGEDGQGNGPKGRGGGRGGSKAGTEPGDPNAKPDAKIDAKTYDSKASLTPGKGAAVIEGTAGGKNIRGEVHEQIKSEYEEAKKSDADPLTDQQLPRPIRDHVKDYFEALREGK